MRGKPKARHLFDNNIRITPADAGKTVLIACEESQAVDHPRGCGENQRERFYRAAEQGSPPRMRGKLAVSGFFVASDGITPADAGKTCIMPCLECLTQDHPRGCGENSLAMEHRPRYQGSPPRMRGKPGVKYGMSYAVRDHPRGCGENINNHFFYSLS